MNEEVKPHINLADLKKWSDMAEELKQLKAKEAALRLKLFKSVFVEPKEGTNKFNLAAGYVLKATLPISRKVDQVAFEATMKLNMGQWLSIPFVLLGIVGLYWSLKRNKRAVIIR